MPSKNELTAQQIVELIKEETGKEIKVATFYGYAHRGQAPQRLPEKVGNTPVWDRRKILEWIHNRPGRGARTDISKPRRRTKEPDTTE